MLGKGSPSSTFDSVWCVCVCVSVVSPGWVRCSDRSERKDNCTQSQSVCTVHVYTQQWSQHTHEQSRNVGMSVGVAWFPDFGHIVASIF